MDPVSWDYDNAWLIYSAGVSMEMEYDSEGSGTTDSKIEYALKNFWGFSNADVKQRIWHLLTWEDDLKDELDEGRPILYGGCNNIICTHGHSWVIDGYNTSDEFHCNWGWGGLDDGMYSLGVFDPASKPYGYNEWESAIFDAYPDKEAGPIDGDDLICYGSNESYILNCCPTGVSVSWSKSSNLNWVGTPSGVNCSATSSDSSVSGEGWIKATITKTDNSVVFVTKDVWVGKPMAPTTNPAGTYPYPEMDVDTYKQVYLSSVPGASSFTGNWSASGNISTYGSTSGAYHYFYGESAGLGTFYVTTSNACGTSSAKQGILSVITEGSGEDPPPLVAFISDENTTVDIVLKPNPVTSQLTISFEEPFEDSIKKHNIKIFDLKSNLIKTDVMEGMNKTIDVSSLDDGIYVVHLIIEGKVYYAKFIKSN